MRGTVQTRRPGENEETGRRKATDKCFFCRDYTGTGKNQSKRNNQQKNRPPQNRNRPIWTDGKGCLTSFGLNGISDIGHNIGYVLAMLPDMLVGLFTGKTKSINLKDNMMPIASIVTGMFVKNPILKMILIGMGGLNLLNKAGHGLWMISKHSSTLKQEPVL